MALYGLRPSEREAAGGAGQGRGEVWLAICEVVACVRQAVAGRYRNSCQKHGLAHVHQLRYSKLNWFQQVLLAYTCLATCCASAVAHGQHAVTSLPCPHTYVDRYDRAGAVWEIWRPSDTPLLSQYLWQHLGQFVKDGHVLTPDDVRALGVGRKGVDRWWCG